MMTGLSRYYFSRLLISVIFGILFALTGSPWWGAILAGVAAFLFFLWAPRSGRYVVQPEYGATALRRDERTQFINDKAGRNAFILTVLVLAGGDIYFGALARNVVPLTFLHWTLLIAVLVYYLSDFWLRRT
jgi:hypothetical protein